MVPSGNYEYYGLRPPAPGEVQARRLPYSPGWTPPDGLRELYGLRPAKPPEGGTPPSVEQGAAAAETAADEPEKRSDEAAAIIPVAGEGPVVQAKQGGGAAQGETEGVHAAAARGTSGASGQLPYLAEIQRAFGRHDVSHVKAHTGQVATEASLAMGAAAFTAGEHVAFAGTPSLDTAAHEAAHVIQQRSGVQLKGGVGEVGDVYEQHADRVADRVVQGRSAEDLLDEMGGGGRGAGGVQRMVTKGDGGQAYDNLDRLLAEFSPSFAEAIRSNEKLLARLKDLVGDGTHHSIDLVMRMIEEQVGKITEAECSDIVFDPVAKKWVVPDDAEVWRQFLSGYEKSKGKMSMPFEAFAAKAQEKAEKEEASKRPIDINNDGQLQALWGPNSHIDKHERVQAIVALFEDSGFTVENIVESTQSSSDTPPMLFDIIGHPTISKFEIHPGGGIHKAPYIRISSSKGMIKVVNKNSDPAYDKLNEKPWKYVEVSK